MDCDERRVGRGLAAVPALRLGRAVARRQGPREHRELAWAEWSEWRIDVAQLKQSRCTAVLRNVVFSPKADVASLIVGVGPRFSRARTTT